MHRVFLLLVLISTSLFFAGCASTDQRLDNLEGQMHHVQVLDLRLSNAENRLTRVEGQLSGMRDTYPSGRAVTGKKSAAHEDEKSYAFNAPAAQKRTAASALRPAASSPQATPYLEPSPAPVQILGVPQRPSGLLAGGSRGEPAGMPAGAAPAAGKTPAPALEPLGLGTSFSVKPTAATMPARPAAADAPDSTPEKTGVGEYDAALALYYKGQYDKAQEQFSAFLDRHPASSLTPNAMYWRGECLYARNEFDSAIIIFKDLAGKYPKHPKAAAALLKAGFAYARIKDMENARFYWQILVDDFPQSEPASIARKRLTQG